MDKEGFKALIDAYLSGTATPSEKKQFLSLLDEPGYRNELESVLEESFLTDRYAMPLNADYTGKLLQQLNVQINTEKSRTQINHRVHFLKTTWLKYAASIILVSGAAAYLWNTQLKHKNSETVIADRQPLQNDRASSQKAVLTLSSGKQIPLSASAEQQFQEGTLTIRNAAGELVYSPSTLAVYNTMTTPKGGQYRLVLADGTRVWLNATSSITYPTAFPDKERVVSITGEAYFDVSASAKQPFIVKTNRDSITVLGTQFNVNAYDDEPMQKTSLVEGKIKVNDLLLKPGQAAAGNKITSTNLGQDLAWKNGLFNFEDATLQSMMRQLSRWYDIDVSYEPGVTNRIFGGEMRKDVSLSAVLAFLKGLGIDFKQEEKHITILSTKK